MAKANSIQAALDYHVKYDNIPKDYMERLSWLTEEIKVKPEHLSDLLEKIEQLKKIQWNEVTYIFYMTPKPTPRPKLAKNTFIFYVSGAKMNKEIFQNFIDQHSEMEAVISTPCSLDTRVYIQTPASMSVEEKLAAELGLVHNVNAPDWDNLGKAYSDMVQDVLISNDSLVFKGTVQKFYSVLPRIEVKVRFMTIYDCKFNKRSVEKRKSFIENPKTIKGLECII